VGTDLGGGVVTRTDVEYLADLTLDVRDIQQSIDAGGTAAISIYTNGKNSEIQPGILYKLTDLSTELASLPASRMTPAYLFHLYGLADRVTDVGYLSANGGYADSYVRNAIQSLRPTATRAATVLNMWMYATHVLYQGVDICQKKVEADNPSQFDLAGGGLDEFIALWIGSGQTHGSAEGYGLYALAEKADQLFVVETDDSGSASSGDLAESSVNRQLKLLYQEGAGIFSFPDVCTSSNAETPKLLWSVVNRMISQMYIPIIRMLIVSVLEQDALSIDLYATAIVPQVAQCRPSSFKRLKEELLQGQVNFQRTDFILSDLQEVYSCFGLTCNDIGLVEKAYDSVTIPTCVAARDNAPMALYQPSSNVHPVRIFNGRFSQQCPLFVPSLIFSFFVISNPGFSIDRKD
jgi:hypothetical protein